MTVETGSAQNTSRPAAPAEAKHAKGKPGAGAGAGAGAGGMGGFMAILASLDVSGAAGTTALVGDVAVSARDAALAAAGRDASALKALRALDATAQSALAKFADALSDLEPTAASAADIDKLLQGLEGDGAVATALLPLPAPTDVHVQTDVPLDPSVLLAQSAQWSAVPAPVGEPANPNLVAGVLTHPAGATKLPHPGATPESAAALNAAAGDTGMDPLGKVGKAHKDAAARLASAEAALAVPVEASTAASSRQVQLPPKVAETPMTPIAAALAAANALISTPARREDATRERSVFRTNAAESSAITQSYQPSASGVAAPSALEAPTPTDMYVAEKVAYWISNDIQNAEMKLDGIGEMPVEVSIRMQGNEAHIAFRSDELQARAALENASQHLKDMLQREGLVLSGVSVGTAGAGDAGDQERNRSRQGARQSGVASVQPATSDTVSGAGRGRASGGSLDLFV
ncbi:MAG: flagellar hook-length control protein FliK [Pseudomonadota bacterium]